MEDSGSVNEYNKVEAVLLVAGVFGVLETWLSEGMKKPRHLVSKWLYEVLMKIEMSNTNIEVLTWSILHVLCSLLTLMMVGGKEEAYVHPNEDSKTYTISKVSEMTGLTVETLRYYEKMGLIATPRRGAGAQQKRMYSREDIVRIQFLTYLKRTNMPLKRIREYVQRYAEQDDKGCHALLDVHRQAIERQMAELTKTLELIRYKLDHFQEIKDGKTKEDSL